MPQSLLAQFYAPNPLSPSQHSPAAPLLCTLIVCLWGHVNWNQPQGAPWTNHCLPGEPHPGGDGGCWSITAWSCPGECSLAWNSVVMLKSAWAGGCALTTSCSHGLSPMEGRSAQRRVPSGLAQPESLPQDSLSANVPITEHSGRSSYSPLPNHTKKWRQQIVARGDRMRKDRGVG